MTHLECCTIVFMINCIEFPMFTLKKNLKCALSPCMSYDKGLLRST